MQEALGDLQAESPSQRSSQSRVRCPARPSASETTCSLPSGNEWYIEPRAAPEAARISFSEVACRPRRASSPAVPSTILTRVLAGGT